MSSSWVPDSTTWPAWTTAMESAVRMVERRWAMTRVVRPTATASRACWTMRSDWESRALVASSRRRIFGDRMMALAMAIRCFCPPEI
ncbi:hypothetical protein AXF42_Ash007476 [Apostasia shenzhenica]|uniref:Uncharacterized protein n=1 Tax=Apostasia shenzhenica TaxID=1088818 RepID=A0A2I0A5K2_9ASPA|nr:hypothetical protein AXF42_Ash007476 [Apostasia shenzhenica]